MVERAVDALLWLLALVCAAWAVLLSALCIGDACPEDLRVTWWAWVAIGAAVVGGPLALRPGSRRLGRVLLAVPIVVAVAATFAGG